MEKDWLDINHKEEIHGKEIDRGFVVGVKEETQSNA